MRIVRGGKRPWTRRKQVGRACGRNLVRSNKQANREVGI